jgi:hypothetical protein
MRYAMPCVPPDRDAGQGGAGAGVPVPGRLRRSRARGSATTAAGNKPVPSWEKRDIVLGSR